MGAYIYSNPTVANANSASAFKTWLDECKAAGNKFLEDLTISLTGSGATASVRITDTNGSYFEHFNISNELNPHLSGAEGILKFSNGTIAISKGDNANEGWHRCYITKAILNDNGLFITATYAIYNATAAPTSAANIATGLFGLVKDVDGKMGGVVRNITVYNKAITESGVLKCIASNSTISTDITLTPVYNSPQTGLVPIIINAELTGVTFPTFFTSLQTQLPSLGLQEGRMDASDYITNGYCFIRG